MIRYVFQVGDYTPTEDVNQKVVRLYNECQAQVLRMGGSITWVKSFSKEPAMLLVELPESVDPTSVLPGRGFEQKDFITNVF